MTTFKATTEGVDKLGLRAVLEHYANDQWLPDYYNKQQHAEIVFDQFKRQVPVAIKHVTDEPLNPGEVFEDRAYFDDGYHD